MVGYVRIVSIIPITHHPSPIIHHKFDGMMIFTKMKGEKK
jgi:hypothetical protein